MPVFGSRLKASQQWSLMHQTWQLEPCALLCWPGLLLHQSMPLLTVDESLFCPARAALTQLQARPEAPSGSGACKKPLILGGVLSPLAAAPAISATVQASIHAAFTVTLQGTRHPCAHLSCTLVCHIG